MDRCNSHQVSIDSLSHEAQRLKKSLETAHEALGHEREQSAAQQASKEELGVTTARLQTSLHLASDCLEDEKSRCKMYQASIASLTAKMRSLERSLDLSRMDLNNHKRHEQDSIVKLEAKVQELGQALDLARKNLEDQTIRCTAQEASMLVLNNKVSELEGANQSTRGDLRKSRQRCSVQQLSIKDLEKLKQELENALQSSRGDLKAKSQLCSSQQSYIDNFKDAERKLQQSLDASQMETQAEKDRSSSNLASYHASEKQCHELTAELELTRGRLERAEQHCNDRRIGMTDSDMDTSQLEDIGDNHAAGTELSVEDVAHDKTSTSQFTITLDVPEDARESEEKGPVEAVTHLQRELENTTNSLQIYGRVLKKIVHYSLEGEIPDTTLTQALSALRMRTERDSEVARTHPALLRARREQDYNSNVLKSLLRHILPDEYGKMGFESGKRQGSVSDNEQTLEAPGVPARFLGITYSSSSADDAHDKVVDRAPIRYNGSCGDLRCEDWNCHGDKVAICNNKICLNAAQTGQLCTAVVLAAMELEEQYDSLPEWMSPTNERNCRSLIRLYSMDGADYQGASERKTLAGLSLIDQIVDSMTPTCPNPSAGTKVLKYFPHNPNRGLKIIRGRVALYRSIWCQATDAKNALTT
jgi:hypothetical protein